MWEQGSTAVTYSGGNNGALGTVDIIYDLGGYSFNSVKNGEGRFVASGYSGSNNTKYIAVINGEDGSPLIFEHGVTYDVEIFYGTSGIGSTHAIQAGQIDNLSNLSDNIVHNGSGGSFTVSFTFDKNSAQDFVIEGAYNNSDPFQLIKYKITNQ